MAEFFKRSRSKGNSLPPTKRFDFTTVVDDFEELQRGFVSKETNADTKKCMRGLWVADLQLVPSSVRGVWTIYCTAVFCYCISGAFEV